MTAKACLKECMFLVSIEICPINVHIWLVCVGSSGSCCSVALWNLHKVFHFSVCSLSLSLSLSLSSLCLCPTILIFTLVPFFSLF